MKNAIYRFSLLAIVALMLNGCAEEPGFGGSSAITGTLHQKVYDENFTQIIEEVELADAYVYLSIANTSGYIERVRTAFNGSYEFNNLNPGEYVVYVYSMDTTRLSLTDVTIEKPVIINAQDESIDAGLLTVAVSRTSGNSSISGRVMIQSQTNPNVQYPAQDKRVYIIYNDDLAYRTSTLTTFDGYYTFDQLPTGRYKVYTYSKDIDNISLNANIPVIDSLTITQNGTDATLLDFVVY